MNMLFFLVGGASAGWVTYKIYHVFFAVKTEDDETSKRVEIKTTTKSTGKPVKDEIIEKTTQKSKAKSVKKKTTMKTKKPIQSENKIDDLSKLKGVGPKLIEALEEIGVFNYEQLYTPSIDDLLLKLKMTKGKFKRGAISAIVDRAKLADKHQ